MLDALRSDVTGTKRQRVEEPGGTIWKRSEEYSGTATKQCLIQYESAQLLLTLHQCHLFSCQKEEEVLLSPFIKPLGSVAATPACCGEDYTELYKIAKTLVRGRGPSFCSNLCLQVLFSGFLSPGNEEATSK